MHRKKNHPTGEQKTTGCKNDDDDVVGGLKLEPNENQQGKGKEKEIWTPNSTSETGEQNPCEKDVVGGLKPNVKQEKGKEKEIQPERNSPSGNFRSLPPISPNLNQLSSSTSNLSLEASGSRRRRARGSRRQRARGISFVKNPSFLQPDNFGEVLKRDVPKTPAEFLNFHNEYRKHLIDKEGSKEEGKYITTQDRSLISHVSISTDSNEVVFKIKEEDFYLPVFKAKPHNEQNLKWHEFKQIAQGGQQIEGSKVLDYCYDYTSLETASRKKLQELTFEPGTMADCLDNLSLFDRDDPKYAESLMMLLLYLPESGRFGGLARKLALSFNGVVQLNQADVALLHEWGRLSRFQILYSINRSLFGYHLGTHLNGILHFIDENVAVLKSLTYDKTSATPKDIHKFCDDFKKDYLKVGSDLYNVFH